jgi:hypothetical protein
MNKFKGTMARPSWVGAGKAVEGRRSLPSGSAQRFRPLAGLMTGSVPNGKVVGTALCASPTLAGRIKAGASGGSGRPLFIVLRFNFCLLAGAVLTWVCAKNQILPVATLTVSMNHGSST